MNLSQDECGTLNDFFNFLDSVELKAVQDNISIEVNQSEDIHLVVNNQINELENELNEQEQKENELTAQLEEVKATAIKEISELKSKRESKLNIQKRFSHEALSFSKKKS